MTREIRNPFTFRRVGPDGMMHCCPWLKLPCFYPPLGQVKIAWFLSHLLASSTEFSGSDFKVSLWFQPPPAAFGELICDPTFRLFCLPIFHRSLFLMAGTASVALGVCLLFCHYFAVICLLSRRFCLFIAFLCSWTCLISAVVSYPPICVLSYGRCLFAWFVFV